MVLRQPPRVFYSCAFFILIMTLVIVTKPASLFLPDGRIRPFGVDQQSASNQHHTILSIGVVVIIAAVLSMFLFGWIDMASSSSSLMP
jgi:hypothetical protein